MLAHGCPWRQLVTVLTLMRRTCRISQMLDCQESFLWHQNFDQTSKLTYFNGHALLAFTCSKTAWKRQWIRYLNFERTSHPAQAEQDYRTSTGYVIWNIIVTTKIHPACGCIGLIMKRLAGDLRMHPADRRLSSPISSPLRAFLVEWRNVASQALNLL